jgi:hypothetical protein
MVNKVIRECQVCVKSKAARHKPYRELQPLPIPEKAWDLISMDFITDLLESKDPQTQARHDSILVIVDRLIKYAYFWLYRKDTHAEGLAFIFLRVIVANHGLPKEIISDRDRLFTSKFWKALVAELGTKHRMSTAYHP